MKRKIFKTTKAKGHITYRTKVRKTANIMEGKRQHDGTFEALKENKNSPRILYIMENKDLAEAEKIYHLQTQRKRNIKGSSLHRRERISDRKMDQ